MDIKYFDHAATTKVKKEVLEEMMPYLQNEYGNPSSLYSIGRSARKKVEEARKRVAKLINAKPDEIYFTSCGSESDNTAIKGIAYANRKKGNHIITSKIEHPAVLHTCNVLEKQGYKVTYLNVNKDGIVDIDELKRSININTILITIMTANNEIGTIQPIEEIARIAKMYNIFFHTDAVQACGNMPIDVKNMGIDSLSLSGHKIYAPKGIGALYVKKQIEFEKLIEGGHQENNKRAGTENVAQIVGLGKACEISLNNIINYQKHLKELREYFLKRIKEEIPFIHINGTMNKRLPGNINIAFKFVRGESLLFHLDEKYICASSGSACSSGANKPSHVLKAIGLEDDMANSSLRLTFGDENTLEDVDYLVDNLVEIVKEQRSKSKEYIEASKN